MYLCVKPNSLGLGLYYLICPLTIPDALLVECAFTYKTSVLMEVSKAALGVETFATPKSATLLHRSKITGPFTPAAAE